MSPNRELATKTVSYVQLLKAVIPDPADWKPAAFVTKFQFAFSKDYALLAQAAELMGATRTISEAHFASAYTDEAKSIAAELSKRLASLDGVLGLAGLYHSAVLSRSGEVTAAALRAAAMARFNETPAEVYELLRY